MRQRGRQGETSLQDMMMLPLSFDDNVEDDEVGQLFEEFPFDQLVGRQTMHPQRQRQFRGRDLLPVVIGHTGFFDADDGDDDDPLAFAQDDLSSSSSRDNGQDQDSEGGEHEVHPAASSTVNALPVHTCTPGELASTPVENKSCCICLEDFGAGEEQRTLPCFHRFHKTCIDTWLRRNGTCPVCKQRVGDD